ncbi:malate dehydrogenase (oxaloacetate-decarboxylating)(NADP+) [Natronocella acetinitrilica]|uniref:NADP-dependent malic enzyme n=1 Tax=Natronocella acetinitrilica TaxID=414046 RepID=A0AAE3KCB3_9GAMM|nr:NADP-dependent malic enzyme [Natronocella acetinitrilica]MCP1675561.1 malate dehydrogenase (oxaloacetate-decarboxylating)(NADP+) [Natronocella acetinitrilica]
MSNDFDEQALRYHREPTPGKLAITATKPLANQRDLSLAYSPGVAAACRAIVDDPATAADYTARGNLVAVISNGTAVLGLGNIGPLASKPVMEGKAVLFKKFANIDVFDLEVSENDPEEFIKTVARLEPTFGGINLEDIKAPECFVIERELRKRMNIPVFHDDQHGTAIIVCAAVLNGLRIVNKELADVRVVCSGAGAAALACLDLLVKLGIKREHITICDIDGVVYQGREASMDEWKAIYAQDTEARTLGDVIGEADIFMGLSAPNVLKPEMVKRMAKDPLILALANPVPEIQPELAREVRPDALIATGRSDYPNQVNNVLCFPYIFRGALDVGATGINDEMKLAAVKAIADLAMDEPSELVAKAYGGNAARFGPDYLIPSPFDPRLLVRIAPAVAKAAMESGVATRPMEDFQLYRQGLLQFVYKSGLLMKPLFERARQSPKRLAYAEGEDRRVLQAAQQAADEGLAHPILVGRPAVIEARLGELGLRLRDGQDMTIVDVDNDPRFRDYWTEYQQIMGRKGVSPEDAKALVRTNTTAIASLMVRKGDADCMICGSVGKFHHHLRQVEELIGTADDVQSLSTITTLILPAGTFFLCDTHATPDPTADELVEMTVMAARQVQAFGLQPKVALVNRSNFGTHDTESARAMRRAVEELHRDHPDLEVDGEMHADVALSQDLRETALPGSRLTGAANLFIMPNVDAAHIAYNLLKALGGGVSIGPILVGARLPVHVVTESVTVRGLVNMTALTVAQAEGIATASAADQ